MLQKTTLASALTELQSILTELANHSTDANQLITHTKLDTLEASLTSIEAQLSGLATEAKQDSIILEIQNIISEFAGLATEAKQDIANTSLASIDTKLTDNATETTLSSVLTELQSILTELANHATDTKQDLIIAELQDLVTNTTGLATETTLSSALTELLSINTKLTDNATATNQLTEIARLDSILLELQSILLYEKQDIESVQFFANTAGTGYSSGDFLTRYDILSKETSAILSSFWFNNTTGLAISAPTLGDYGSDKELQAKSPTIVNITTASPFSGGLVVSEYKIIALDDYQFNGAKVPASYSDFDSDSINYTLPSITALSEDVILIYHV